MLHSSQSSPSSSYDLICSCYWLNISNTNRNFGICNLEIFYESQRHKVIVKEEMPKNLLFLPNSPQPQIIPPWYRFSEVKCSENNLYFYLIKYLIIRSLYFWGLFLLPLSFGLSFLSRDKFVDKLEVGYMS